MRPGLRVARSRCDGINVRLQVAAAAQGDESLPCAFAPIPVVNAGRAGRCSRCRTKRAPGWCRGSWASAANVRLRAGGRGSCDASDLDSVGVGLRWRPVASHVGSSGLLLPHFGLVLSRRAGSASPSAAFGLGVASKASCQPDGDLCFDKLRSRPSTLTCLLTAPRDWTSYCNLSIRT